jgi:hypothetical protein
MHAQRSSEHPPRPVIGQAVGVGFHVSDRMGGDHPDASAQVIEAALAELDEPVDPEHPDVSLTHESEWSLGAFPSGLVIWENVADPIARPRHMRDVPRDKLRQLWAALAAGDVERVDREPWQPGYG